MPRCSSQKSPRKKRKLSKLAKRILKPKRKKKKPVKRDQLAQMVIGLEKVAMSTIKLGQPFAYAFNTDRRGWCRYLGPGSVLVEEEIPVDELRKFETYRISLATRVFKLKKRNK